MPSVNLLGGNSNDYVLGRGIVYFQGESTSGTVYANAFRDLGNATEFTITIESETKEHQSSLEGLKTTDLEVLLSQKMNINFTLDEINDNNKALFFLGTVVGGDSAVGGSANLANASAVASNAGVISPAHCNLSGTLATWLWYDLFLVSSGAKIRAYDFAASQIVTNSDVIMDEGSSSNPLTEGTDYELDRKTGRIRFLTGGPSNVTGARLTNGGVQIQWAAHPDTEGVRNATTGVDDYLSRVNALLNSGVTGALKFVQENPVNNVFTEYHFPQVTLKPDGDFSGISDEFTTLTMTGAVEKFTGTQPNGFTSEFLSITERKTYGTD